MQIGVESDVCLAHIHILEIANLTFDYEIGRSNLSTIFEERELNGMFGDDDDC